MKFAKLTLAQRLRSFDPFLLACTGGLSLISLLMLWGGKSEFGTRAFIMQLAMTVLVNLLIIFIASLDYEYIIEKYHLVPFLGLE